MIPPDRPDGNVASQVAPAKQRPRKLRVLTTDDWLSLAGSAVSSFALVDILYEHILDTSGTLGFLVCWYLAFLLLYGAVVGATNSRAFVVERLVTATLYVAAAVVLTALGSAVVFIFGHGWRALDHLNFFTHDMSGVAPTAPLTQGGILHAIVGSVVEVGLAVAISLPVGIGTAVYMSEVGGRLSRLRRGRAPGRSERTPRGEQRTRRHALEDRSQGRAPERPRGASDGADSCHCAWRR